VSVRRTVGTSFLSVYRLWVRTRAKSFSVLASGAFASFGVKTVLEPPIRLSGEARMAIGSYVYVGAGSWLQVLDGEGDGIALSIGDGTNIVGACVLSAVRSVVIGKDVLMARNVYIADHMHAFEDAGTAVIKQGITRVAPVEIGDGAWLGENVVIGPGVRIGRGAVVGANAVVLDDVGDYCVAAGVPSRTIRSFAPTAARPLAADER
jgi:acetyltransferase-like isoleucine patch superfamily enzyme